MRRRVRWAVAIGVAVSLAAVPLAVASSQSTVYSSPAVAVAPTIGSAAALTRPRTDRLIPRAHSAASPSAIVAPRPAPQRTAPPSSLQANFNGVSSRDSALTNFGAEFEPPDQGMCVGNGYLLEMVNSAYQVYKTNGTPVSHAYNVNDVFDEGASEFTSDPRCHYDAANHTWYATILYIGSDNASSRLDVAVNTSGDPTKAWTTYRIDTTDSGGNGCPCFGDQPTLGIDGSNVYVTTNEFSITGPEFNGAQIYAIPKADLVQAGPTAVPAHYEHYGNLSAGGATAASIQPAISTGSANAEYFLSSLDPNGTFDQRIAVWAMTKVSGIDKGITPTLSSYVTTSEAYGIPPGGEQKGASSLINSGDDRMEQVQYINGHVLGALDTSVTIPNDPAARAGIAWFDVVPALAKGVLSGASLKDGYLADPGNYLLYPAIVRAPDGRTVLTFSVTGANRYPSAAYAVQNTASSAFGPVTVAGAGTGPYDPNATRWGDYSWSVLDPSGKSVWGAAEYVPPVASQTPDHLRNWGTRVFDISTP